MQTYWFKRRLQDYTGALCVFAETILWRAAEEKLMDPTGIDRMLSGTTDGTFRMRTVGGITV